MHAPMCDESRSVRRRETQERKDCSASEAKGERICWVSARYPLISSGSSASAGSARDLASTKGVQPVVCLLFGSVELTFSHVLLQILSLESRSKDLFENNKKLLTKIQQLEKIEADADAQIDALRQENTRLATQADALTSTVNSQSSLIIGLRTTVQRLSVRGVSPHCRCLSARTRD